MICKKFKTPLYGSVFNVILYDEDQELESYLKNKGIELDTEVRHFDGGVFNDDNMLYLVLNRRTNKSGVKYPTPGIIAHEALHLTHEIFTDIHHKIDQYNDEPHAYLLGWIVNRIHELINKNS